MYKFLIVCLLMNLSVRASVWETTNDWSLEWEGKYKKWIQSEEYNRKIFKNKKSIWYGTKTDCADAIYAVRIIFSSLNGLPFKIYNPSGTRKGAQFTFIDNEIKSFDQIPAGPKRIIRFIEYIGASVGSDHLARHASYPVSLDLIGSGDFYIYRGPNYNHSYVIKDRLLTGNFVLFSSTTPAAARKLSVKVGLPGYGFEVRPWGYKRFKWPGFLELSNDKIPNSLGSSNEMYLLAKKVGKRKILKTIRKLMKAIDENPEEQFLRETKNICNMLEDRKTIIEETVEYLSKNNNRCLTLIEYDDYSTPSRDRKLFNAIKGISELWKNMRKHGRTSEVSENLRLAMNVLVGHDDSEEIEGHWKWSTKKNGVATIGSRQLEKLCTVEIKYLTQAVNVNFLSFYKLYKKRKLSHHPNDHILRRWGIKVKKTGCKKFY